jgi:hypothetical protein
MAQNSPGHARRFSIADKEAVRILMEKAHSPHSSRIVDEEKLIHALIFAGQQYTHSRQKVRQAFFHGLLTGYAVGLKHR